MAASATRATALPPRAGLGLKPEHYRTILDSRPDIGFFEVHAENYMGAGGPPHRFLEAIAARYPLSLHGVGLSIGGEGDLDPAHLERLRHLAERYRPASFSEHLAWSTHDSAYLNDLLPLPYTEATLERVARHVDEAQQAVGMRLLLENPSTYVLFEESTIEECDFLARDRRQGAAAACCSTSTTSWSRRSTTGSIRSPISTASRSSWSARSISPAMTRRPTAPASGC